MKDRIKQIMDYKSITAGELADLLEVQRSNISHILNGRNKPGAVFLERFLRVFPEIDARWLITGEGSMRKEPAKPEPQMAAEFRDEKAVEHGPVTFPAEKKVDKVILLHADGTFTIYGNR